MMQSICPVCQNTTFEVVENTPQGSRYKVMFIQCAKCGSVLGVQPYEYIPLLVHKVQKMLLEIMKRMGMSTHTFEE